jgi:ADP-ribose pyrophosphatase YjhB (NUDIX family)
LGPARTPPARRRLSSWVIEDGSSVVRQGMNFCSHCAAPVVLKVPAGDNRARFVCDRCGTIHYQNPKVVTGCIPEWEDRILLCRRAIEPRHGLWTLPAGFMENGETTMEGAARETLEEARAEVDILGLYTTFNLPHIDQVYMLFRARLRTPEFGPTDESLEVGLFAERDLPWDRLAFPVVAETLKLYFQDRTNGGFGTYVGDIVRLPGDGRRYRVAILQSGPQAV